MPLKMSDLLNQPFFTFSWFFKFKARLYKINKYVKIGSNDFQLLVESWGLGPSEEWWCGS